jgi:apolipoprotein N-acyltransferase
MRRGGRTAVLICKDLDFPETARELARAGVKVVLVPAWDWPGSEEIHERMAIVRGVEMGFSVARSGRQGMVSATDSRGRVIVARATSRKEDALATVDLPIGIGMTSYARAGNDWFGQFTVGLTIILMLRLGVSIWYAARIRRLKSMNRITPTGVVSVDVGGHPQQHPAAAPVEEEERIYRAPKRPSG